MAYWDANRAVFRVVELATEEGDLRFQGLRVRALNAVTVTLARVIASGTPNRTPAGTDAMAVAATLISMLAHVAAHRYGFEFWGIRTTAMVDTQAPRAALGGHGQARARQRRRHRRAGAAHRSRRGGRRGADPRQPGSTTTRSRGPSPARYLTATGLSGRAAAVGERQRGRSRARRCTGRPRRSRRRARRASSSGPGSSPSRRCAGGARGDRPRRPRTG